MKKLLGFIAAFAFAAREVFEAYSAFERWKRREEGEKREAEYAAHHYANAANLRDINTSLLRLADHFDPGGAQGSEEANELRNVIADSKDFDR